MVSAVEMLIKILRVPVRVTAAEKDIRESTINLSSVVLIRIHIAPPFTLS